MKRGIAQWQLEEVLEMHKSVLLQLRSPFEAAPPPGPPEPPKGKSHSWFAALVLYSRSSNFASIARMLSEKGHWEAAAALIRTVWEDAGVLAYIEAMGRLGLHEHYAWLYNNSNVLQTLKEIGAEARRGVISDQEANTRRRNTEQVAEEFKETRSRLWERVQTAKGKGTKRMRKDTWNGLTVADTFEQAGLGGSYDLNYWITLCPLIHSSSDVFRYGFLTETGFECDEPGLQEHKVFLIGEGLKCALVHQIGSAYVLLDLLPDNWAPGLDNNERAQMLLESVRSAH